MARQVEGRSVLDSALEPGEPCFIIRGNDTIAWAAVGYWLRQAEMVGVSPDVLESAEAIHAAMLAWRQSHGVKVPD